MKPPKKAFSPDERPVSRSAPGAVLTGEELSEVTGGDGGSGLTPAPALPAIELPGEKRLVVKPDDPGHGETGGGADISVPEGSSLVIVGNGTLKATGGNAG